MQERGKLRAQEAGVTTKGKQGGRRGEIGVQGTRLTGSGQAFPGVRQGG